MPEGAHVHRLLLDPGQLAGIRIFRDHGQQVVGPKRLEQFQADDGKIPGLRPQRARDQVVVHLASAEDDPLNLPAMRFHQGVIDQAPEAVNRQVFEPRPGGPQPQQTLRRHDHQRTRPAMQRLAPERVEVIRRRARIKDPDVALGRQLQEPFEARARMLRAAAFVPVRKEKRQPRRLAPLGQSRNDELVDHHLRAIREIAELRLPADQGF